MCVRERLCELAGAGARTCARACMCVTVCVYAYVYAKSGTPAAASSSHP